MREWRGNFVGRVGAFGSLIDYWIRFMEFRPREPDVKTIMMAWE